MDLSSITVRDDAKIERRTVGVTGIRRLDVSLPTEEEGDTYGFEEPPVDLPGGLAVEDMIRLRVSESVGSKLTFLPNH